MPGPRHRAASFRNAWVHALLLRLPTLAVAVDDALLAFVDHAKDVLGGPEEGSPGGEEGLTERIEGENIPEGETSPVWVLGAGGGVWGGARVGW